MTCNVGQVLEFLFLFQLDSLEMEEQQKQRSPKLIKSYRQKPIRFVVLMLACCAMFGNMFCFNIMQALEVPIVKELQISQTQFNLFYSIFALPNILIAVFVGILVDVVGVRLMFFLMCLGVGIFQLMITIGLYFQSYAAMLVGRTLFGAVSESLITAQLSFITFWFAGQELSFAIGISLTAPELGDALNSLLTPLIHEHFQNLMAPFYFSLIICLMSIVCVLLAILMDKRADKIDKDNLALLVHLTQTQNENLQLQNTQFNCSDIKKFPPYFWLIVSLCVLQIGMYTPFLDNANHFGQDRFGFSPTQAGRSIVCVDLIGVALSIPLGIIIDKKGDRKPYIIISTFLFALCYLFFYLLQQSENGEVINSGFIAFALLGVSYSFYSNALVPAISEIVDKKYVGTAYGVLLMLQSIVLALFPYLSGLILQKSENHVIGFNRISLFYLLLGCVSIILSMFLYYQDKPQQKIQKMVGILEKQQKQGGKGIVSKRQMRITIATNSSQNSTESQDSIQKQSERSLQNNTIKNFYQIQMTSQ